MDIGTCHNCLLERDAPMNRLGIKILIIHNLYAIDDPFCD